MGQIKGPKEETAMKSEFWVDSIQSDKSKKTCWNLLSGGEKRTVTYNNYNNNSYKTKQNKTKQFSSQSSLSQILSWAFKYEYWATLSRKVSERSICLGNSCLHQWLAFLSTLKGDSIVIGCSQLWIVIIIATTYWLPANGMAGSVLISAQHALTQLLIGKPWETSSLPAPPCRWRQATCSRSESCSLAKPELRLGLLLTLKLTLTPVISAPHAPGSGVALRVNEGGTTIAPFWWFSYTVVMFSVETSLLCVGFTWNYLKWHSPEIARQKRINTWLT